MIAGKSEDRTDMKSLLHFASLALSSAVSTSKCPFPHATNTAPISAAATANHFIDHTETGHAVASWCVAAGRPQATVAVSSASDLATVLRDFWSVSRGFADEDGPMGRQRIIALPNWAEGASDPQLFAALLQHIASCADVCEYVGESLVVAGRHPAAVPNDDEPISPPCPMLLLRAFTSKSSSSSPSGEEVPDGVYDPYANIAADSSSSADGSSEEIDDSIVLSETRKWVEGIIVDMKVCPFSSTADKAGMPIGGVSYPISHASIGEEVYEAFWEQVRSLCMRCSLTLRSFILSSFF